jgi:hypothetical protein
LLGAFTSFCTHVPRAECTCAPNCLRCSVPLANACEAPSSDAPSPAPARAAGLPDEVRQVLAALPELLHGETVELRLAAERLRAAELLGPRASSTRFFAPLAASFELLPAGQPNRVRLRG